MPDISGRDNKEPDKSRFIREKIIKQPMAKKEIAKRALLLLLTAAIFGIVAAVTFVISKPIAQRYLTKEYISDSVAISIPKDEPESISQSTEAVSEESAEETEPIEDVLKTALEKYQYSADDISNLYGSLKTLCQETDRGIVTVHSVKTQVDWFDNPVENTGLYAGVVIAAANGELLILTPEGAVEEADSIKVAFYDGTEAAGEIKQTDKISGMAVVSVLADTLEPDTLKSVKAIELGNSYSVKQGDLVIAVGSPAGMVHSTDYGFVSYVTRNVQVADSVTRIIYANLKSNARNGTFLMNTSGQIVGWATERYKNDGSEDMTVAMAISDYKSVLEKLTNGIPVPYLGIKGQEVSSKMNESGMPLGIYVVDCETDSPAYSAGIQCGDIVTKVGNQKLITMKDYQMKLESLQKDETVTVTVQRNGRDEYKELEYQVTIGAR